MHCFLFISCSELTFLGIDRQLRTIWDKLSLRKLRPQSALEIVRLVSWTANVSRPKQRRLINTSIVNYFAGDH